MKTFNKPCLLALLMSLFSLAIPQRSAAQGNNFVTDQKFYNSLQPYGTWITDPVYGNIWIPDADDGFMPYETNGYWIQTNYGTTWVSAYPWGWATFHYGRWRYDDYYGWEWIPGHQWAPAWVCWRQGAGYYGWAPLGPKSNLSIVLGGGYSVPDNYWICAPQAYLMSPDIHNYFVAPPQVTSIIHQTTPINNTYIDVNHKYIAGPKPKDIQKITHQKVPVYHIGNANKPSESNIQSGKANFYMPVVKKSTDARPTHLINGVTYKQKHPTFGIGAKGGTSFNHANAARLAAKSAAKPVTINLKQAVRNKPKQHVQPTAGQPRVPQQTQQQKTPRNRQGQQEQQQQNSQLKQLEHQQKAAQSQAQKAAQRQLKQQAKAQQVQLREQQKVQQKQQLKQQQAQQKQQQQAEQRQQQAQQKQQQQAEQRQQQAQQRQQQQAQQRQQQAQQKQQQQAEQRQQQAQQRQQQAQQKQQTAHPKPPR